MYNLVEMLHEKCDGAVYTVDVFLIKLTSIYKRIVGALKNYDLNSREKLEPGSAFELGPLDL